MAKLILRSNTTTVNYTIESKSIETTVGNPIKETVELIIRPKSKYTIDANDFTHGVLPNLISSISYRNINNGVLVSVKFSSQPITSEITNISLPISGKLKRIDNTLEITSVTSRDDNVLESTSSIGVVQSTNTASGYVVYKITAASKGFKQVLSKTFLVPDGYYFEGEPTYSISGNNSRYKVSINTFKDSNNRTIRKVFSVFYNFPEENPVIKPSNTITFKAISKGVAINEKEIVATKEEDYKIYNVDYGRTIGLEGGIKHITVNGVPGTEFKILVQDTNKNIYNFKTGGFKTGASFLKGVIPEAVPGIGYGTFNAFVKVDASTTATTISSRVITTAPIKTISEDGVTTEVIPTVVDSDVLAEVSMTLELVNGGVDYTITRPALASEVDTLTDAQITGGITNGTYTVGGGLTNSSIVTWTENNPIEFYDGVSSGYVWDVGSGDDGNAIGINRQPRFDSDQTFVDWDSAYSGESSPLPKEYNNAGTEILTDADNISDLEDWVIGGVEVSIAPTSDSSSIAASDLAGGFTNVYNTVRITMRFSNGSFGTANINPELNLDNFLTLVATS